VNGEGGRCASDSVTVPRPEAQNITGALGPSRGARTRNSTTSWPGLSSSLPMAAELASGCFEVKSAPPFATVGSRGTRCTEDTDSGCLSNRVKGVLHCYRVTGNSRRRLAIESFPAKHHTPTLHDLTLLPRLQNRSWSFPRGDRTVRLDS